MLFFLLLKVEMPTIVGISPFMSRKNFMLIRVEYYYPALFVYPGDGISLSASETDDRFYLSP